MSGRWERVVTLVDRALELDAAERRRFLRAACADDPSLRDEVEALIDAGLTDDRFLEPVLAQGVGGGLGPGVRLGPFEIVRLLGAGGMGAVFEASQDVPLRRVAIKVMSDRLMAGAARRRFAYEIEALGALNHPGIAQVYQAGIHVDERGVAARELHWFAMEYVPGARTLIKYADGSGLDQRARLRLFAEVCDAVHHGHQKGIIHRDLKPDNLLVSEAGRPKVIDFGVARTIDAEQRLTTIRGSASEIVGTLSYMSPEQARGEPADVRSDVYGLGTVLFRLLTGALPIDVRADDFLASARRIVEEPPRRPSALRADLRGDLDAVLLKALEKSPARRYQSAAALAADLRRVLAREPVEARVPSVLDHVRRFARRNRVLVSAAAVVLLVLLGATAVSLDFAFESQRAERVALERSEEADRQRRRVTAMLEKALERGLEISNKLMPEVHALPGGAPVAAKLIDGTVADLERLAALAGDDPLANLTLANAYLRFGDVYGNPVYANLREPEKAFHAYTRALELSERAPPGSFEREAARIGASALRRRCEVRQMRGSAPETRPDLERAWALGRRALEGATGELRDPILLELGLTSHLLSVDAKGRQDLDAAERYAREAVAGFRALRSSGRSEVVETTRHLAAKVYWLGVVLSARDAREAARDSFEEAVTLASGHLDTFQQRLDFALFLMGLGSSERRLGHFVEADAHLGRSRDLLFALRQEDPADPRLLPHLVGCSMEWVYAGDGRTDAPRRVASEEGRRRARDAAASIRALSADSKIVAGFARHLERLAEPD